MYKKCEEILKKLEGEQKINISTYQFPPKQELKLKLKDMLENEVDEKYYLSEQQISKIKNSNFMQEKKRIQEKDCSDTLLARDWKDPKCVEVKRKFGIFDDEKETHQAGSVYDKNGLSPTLDTMQGGWRQPCIEINNATKQGYLKATVGDGVNISSRMKYQRGNVQEQSIQTITTSGGNDRGVVVIPQTVKVRKHKVDVEKLKKTLKLNKKYTNKEIALKLNVSVTTVEHWFRNDSSFSIPTADIWFDLKKLLNIETEEFDKSITEFEEKEGVYEKSNRYYLDNGIAPTLTHASANEKIISDLRIRKLTPKECWRLMGFDDEDFEKASQVNSNAQLYKQAGNSIVVNVLENILKNLL